MKAIMSLSTGPQRALRLAAAAGVMSLAVLGNIGSPIHAAALGSSSCTADIEVGSAPVTDTVALASTGECDNVLGNSVITGNVKQFVQAQVASSCGSGCTSYTYPTLSYTVTTVGLTGSEVYVASDDHSYSLPPAGTPAPGSSGSYYTGFFTAYTETFGYDEFGLIPNRNNPGLCPDTSSGCASQDFQLS